MVTAAVPYKLHNLLCSNLVFLMDMKETISENSNAPAEKKEYEKPSFRFEKVFVTTALSCGKIGGTQQSCISHPSAS